MTSREIILANLRHTGPSRIGLSFSGDRRNDFLFAGPGQPANFEPKRWVEGQVEYYNDPWGNLWRRMKDGSQKGEICKPVLDDWRDLDTLQPPRANREEVRRRFADAFSENPEDKFKLAFVGGWVFNDARYIRGMENYFMDMGLYPEELNRLHETIASYYEEIIRAAGEAGADGMFFGEDMGTQQGLLFSPDMFRTFFKDLYARLLGMAREYGMHVFEHSCGRNREILDDLLDCGVDCFQFDQPAIYDMGELAALFRKRRAALWSPVDIQKVLPTGDKDFIENETERMCRIFDGFLICKNYPDLPGIGVRPEWDDWAYRRICQYAGVNP